jgi:Holliday junction resolvase-like predicted endonuclease
MKPNPFLVWAFFVTFPKNSIFMKNITIIKNSGESADFDSDKLRNSLLQSGASKVDAEFVTNNISNNIVDGMSTRKIYKLAYKLLKKQSVKVAGKYRLKKAIFDMGPTGYPFEHLVSELIKLGGFTTKTGITLEGKCVSHEVDVFAKKKGTTVFVECKFHNDVRKKSDVKVSLYVNSRFHDLKNKYKLAADNQHVFEGWLVTNTRFTTDAIEYGKCAGLKLISWDYPEQGNLRQLVDSSGFHPITTLQSITKKEKSILLENKVILCRHIASQVHLLEKMRISKTRIRKIVSEANQISNIGN